MSDSVTIYMPIIWLYCIHPFFFWNFPASQLGVGAYLQPYRLDNGHREEITANGHGYMDRGYTTVDVLCFLQDDPL